MKVRQIINKNGIPEILIYEEIGRYGFSARDFNTTLTQLQEEGHEAINIRIHSPGGDVFEGNVIYNAIRNATAEINIYIDGIAASMASVIAMAGKKINMAPNAMLMIHNPSGGAWGEATRLRQVADILDKVKGTLIGSYESRTGKTAEELSELMDKETWYTAKEAMDEGFVDAMSEMVAENIAASMVTDPVEAWKGFQIKALSNNTEDTMDPKVLAALGLGTTASAEDAVKAIEALQAPSADLQKLTEENKALKAELAKAEVAKAEALVDAALKAGKITAKQKDHFAKMAKTDYESTKAILDEMRAHTLISEQLIQTTEDQKVFAERKDWDFERWTKEDPKGLGKMKESDTERYNALFNAAFCNKD